MLFNFYEAALKARRTTKKEEPLWAEPEALENNGQRSSTQRTEPGLVRYCPLSSVGVLWSICSAGLQNSYGSVTDMGLPFFIFQMEGFVEAVLYIFPIVGVYVVG